MNGAGLTQVIAEASLLGALPLCLLPVEKSSKTYKTGDFVKATIVEANGHDLIASVN